MVFLKSSYKVIISLWLLFIQNFPGPYGQTLRHRYWKKRLKYLGRRARIDCGVYFQNPEYISISDNCWIDRGVILLAGRDLSTRSKKRLGEPTGAANGELHIGENVHIAPYCIISAIDSGVVISDDCCLSSGVKIYSFSHHFRFDDRPEDSSCSFGSLVDHVRQSMVTGPVVLEENVGVALNAIILPGVRVGKNSFVAAGAMLYSQEFPENSFIVGAPAKRKGDRFLVRSPDSGA